MEFNSGDRVLINYIEDPDIYVHGCTATVVGKDSDIAWLVRLDAECPCGCEDRMFAVPGINLQPISNKGKVNAALDKAYGV